jgi:hypothetical protein
VQRLRLSVAFLLALAVVAAAIWCLASHDMRVRDEQIAGTNDTALIAAIRQLPLTGCVAMFCDLGGDSALIETIPAVAEAQVSVGSPTTLLVHIKPRLPLIIWRTDRMGLLVAPDGTVLGPASPVDLAHLPVVEDPIGAALPAGRSTEHTRLPRVLVDLAAQLRSSLPALLGQPVTLRYDSGLGLVAEAGGLRAIFGDPSHAPADPQSGATGQLAELRAILDALARVGERPAWIDLRWGLHPSYDLA